MSGKRSQVEIGDLVRKTNSTNWVWKVSEIVTPAGHRPHARIVRINYPSDERIFAIAALTDRRLFVEVDETTDRNANGHAVKWEPQTQA